MSSPIIPRNQASGAFQRWEPSAFDAPPMDVAVAAEPETLEPQITEEPAPLEIAPGVTLPTLEDVERIEAEARKSGYDAGYEEGSARGRREAAELHQMVQSLDDVLTQVNQEVAIELQSLAIELARQIVRDTLAVRPEAVLAVVREALAQLPQQAATLRVNPADAQLISQYLADQPSGQPARIVEDDSVARGGALLEAGGSQLDVQVQTRWQRVVEGIARHTPDWIDG
ncbi:MAG: flagellar assembly protein FliH [Rhodocyclaceae bacterium]